MVPQSRSQTEEAEVGVGLVDDGRVMDAMHVRCADEITQYPVELLWQRNVAVGEDGRTVQRGLERDHHPGIDAQRRDEGGLVDHGDQDLDGMEARAVVKSTSRSA